MTNHLFQMYLLIVGSFSEPVTKYAYFTTSSICVLQEHFHGLCIGEQQNINSLMQCTMKCLENDECVLASFDTNRVCYHHPNCGLRYDKTCVSTIGKQHIATFKGCTSGKDPNNPAKCANTCVGKRCERNPKTCKELIEFGYSRGYYYKTNLDVFEDFSRVVYGLTCFIEPKVYFSRIEVLKINHGEGLFSRDLTWHDYRNGFTLKLFSHSHDYFSGLQSMFELNAIGYTTLYIKFSVWKNPYGSLLRRYRNFKMANESQGFSFTFGITDDISSTAGDVLKAEGSFLEDCLGPYQNTPFSAPDKDMDEEVDENCAGLAASGWWFKNCDTTCNLFGAHPYDWGMNETSAQRLIIPGINLTTYQPYWTTLKIEMLKP